MVMVPGDEIVIRNAEQTESASLFVLFCRGSQSSCKVGAELCATCNEGKEEEIDGGEAEARGCL